MFSDRRRRERLGVEQRFPLGWKSTLILTLNAESFKTFAVHGRCSAGCRCSSRPKIGSLSPLAPLVMTPTLSATLFVTNLHTFELKIIKPQKFGCLKIELLGPIGDDPHLIFYIYNLSGEIEFGSALKRPWTCQITVFGKTDRRCTHVLQIYGAYTSYLS